MTSLREAGVVVAHLSRALLDGSRDLRTVPGLVKRILADHLWEQWADPASGRTFGPFGTFTEFVESDASVGGLGSTIGQLRGLCEGDIKARDAIDNQLQEEAQPGRRSDLFDNIQEVKAPTGTSESAALRRLRKDRPDLHSQVLAERLTAHAAMVTAGFRPKTVTVPVTRPEAVARSLLKYMSADDLAQLIAALSAAALSAHRGDGKP